MQTWLRGLAILLWVFGLGVWLAGGANVGWTKTQEQVKTLDEITGIEGIEWKKRFRAGLDFLGAAALAGALCAGLSVWVGKSSRSVARS